MGLEEAISCLMTNLHSPELTVRLWDLQGISKLVLNHCTQDKSISRVYGFSIKLLQRLFSLKED